MLPSEELAEKLLDLVRNNKCVCMNLPVSMDDFTTKQPQKIVLHGKNLSFDLLLDKTSNFLSFKFLLERAFNSDLILVGWNIKRLFSYFKFKDSSLNLKCKVIDLMVVEKFLGIEQQEPLNYLDFLGRFKLVTANNTWLKIYKYVHYPLISNVLPNLECSGVIDSRLEYGKNLLFASYKIESHKHGRLSSHKINERFYVPHTIPEGDKQFYKPRGMDKCFLYADYKSMELCVIAWLTKDKHLNKMIDDGSLYDNLSNEIFVDSGIELSKQQSKHGLIAVMYGCGSATLSGLIGVEKEVAVKIVEHIKKMFPDTFKWFDLFKNSIEVSDFFGRTRQFSDGYSYRSFMIQCAAATICQHKLIAISKNLPETCEVIMNIHDGYLFSVDKKKSKECAEQIKLVMEKKEALYEGLKLNIFIQEGF